MSANAALVCRQPGCGGPASGVCIENFSFEECPNLVDPDTATDEQTKRPIDLAVQALSADDVSTSTRTALNEADCDAFLRRKDGVLVALVAGPWAGKTTLIARIYELTRRAKLQLHGFAGSETIRGFEERCHLSRVAANQEKPDTKRTSRRPPQFLHLCLATQGAKMDLLLCDRSGEDFDDVLEVPGRINSYAEVARADDVLLLVDGVELNSQRHKVTVTARRMLQALLESETPATGRLHLVVTKADRFHGEALNSLNVLATALHMHLQTISPITLHITAARKKLGHASKSDDGVDSLVAAILNRRSVERTYQIPRIESASASPLDRLMQRFGEQP